MFGIGTLAKKAGGWALKKVVQKALKPEVEKVKKGLFNTGELKSKGVPDTLESEFLQEVGVWIDEACKDVFGRYGNDAEGVLLWALGQIEKGAKRQ